MSSIFVRPESPPPRQPTPDLLPPSLPHPPRRVSSQPRIRVNPPPGLSSAGYDRKKTLHSARSYDFLSTRPNTSPQPDIDDRRSLHSSRRPSRSNLSASPVSTACSSPSPSLRSSDDFVPRHRRNLSIAYNLSSGSSSPSPNFFKHSNLPLPAEPLPPVDSLTPYRYTGSGQHIICPKPIALTAPTIYIPDIVNDEPTPRRGVEVERVPEVHHVDTIPDQMQEFKKSSYAADSVLPPLEKHKSLGIACLKFFGIRTQANRHPSSAVVTAM
ncbi:hypothetical protein D9613_005333 [Agrocybe pediades]|uniref:Uncharacterized protein n=1 Tax=Agrocybe pediades TaxID=84607 RepID=A0A8H4QXF1_9AGAR|nr:hypothetical protein D9613_005333 [Agrocybe pediades]